MFSFFRKKVRVTSTNIGSHGKHWYSIYNDGIEPVAVKERFLAAIRAGKIQTIGNEITIIHDPLIRGVLQGNRLITGFPYFKGTRYEECETHLITEWSHAANLEAIIQVKHKSGCALSFFATDYMINKETYKNKKNLEINMVGCIYHLENFDVESINKSNTQLQLSKDFCSYFPTEDERDEINFVGKIHHIKEHFLGEVPGFIITIGVTPDLCLDMFVAKANLKIDISVHKQVCGLAWLQGTLEK
jgi:hypothetical protein